MISFWLFRYSNCNYEVIDLIPTTYYYIYVLVFQLIFFFFFSFSICFFLLGIICKVGNPEIFWSVESYKIASQIGWLQIYVIWLNHLHWRSCLFLVLFFQKLEFGRTQKMQFLRLKNSLWTNMICKNFFFVRKWQGEILEMS